MEVGVKGMSRVRSKKAVQTIIRVTVLYLEVESQRKILSRGET